MQLNLSREALLEPLQKVLGVIERKQTMPILANVLLVAEGEQMTITATDLEIELVATRQLAEPQQAKITLPAQKLAEICKNLPDGAQITLLSDDKDKITVKSGRSRFKLSSLPAEQYPDSNAMHASSSFSISQAQLRQVMEKTEFAMAQQDVRFYLNGLLLELTANSIRTVATDGHRLALAEIAASTQLGENQQVLVPSKGVRELLRMLQDSDDMATVSLDSRQIRVDMGNVCFTGKLIDGAFPDYQRAMPIGCDKKISLNKNDFKQALIRTAILSNEKFKGVRLKIAANMLSMQANNPEQEEAEEQIAIDYHGEEIEVSFNIKYMLDVLNVLDGDDFELEFKDSGNPCKVQQFNPDCSYVIMPMRI